MKLQENIIKENKKMNIKKELEAKVGIANGIYLNRIEIDPLATEVHFERKTDICQYHSAFPMPEEIGNLIDLELEFTLDVGYRLFDTLDDTAITKHEHGYTVKLTLPENDWLYDFLMSFGNKVTIIRPEAIRQTLITKHEAAREHHKGE